VANTLQLAQERYGDDPRYQQYVENTPPILPTFGGLWRALKKMGGAAGPDGGSKPEL